MHHYLLTTAAALLLLLTGYVAGSQHALTPARVYAADDCQTFAQTGHHVCGVFLQYWNDHGGLAQQGYPISEPMSEVSATDGNTYQVQYFERAVFELHPDKAAPNNVLLSLLGTQKYAAKYGGTASATVAPFVGVAATTGATATTTTPARRRPFYPPRPLRAPPPRRAPPRLPSPASRSRTSPLQ